MIGGEHSVDVATTTDRLWRFIAEFENWAPYVIGFQELTRVDAERTVWKLRGDVGILSREVDIQVDVVDWQEGERAEFELTGITERLSGRGVISVAPGESEATGAGQASPSSSAAPGPAVPKPTWLHRLIGRLAARLIRRVRAREAARAPRPATTAGTTQGTPAGRGSAASGDGRRDSRDTDTARLRISLEVAPGGPMAPMLETLMAPMLEQAAEDFGRGVKQAIEGDRDE